MKQKVTRILTSKITNNEFRELMDEVNAILLNNNTLCDLTTIVPAFTQVHSQYCKAIDQNINSQKETQMLQQADKDLISCWQRQKAYLNGLKTSFEDEKTKEAAAQVYNIMATESHLVKCSFEDRYGRVEKLLNRIDELDKTVLQAAQSAKWFNSMKLKLKTVREIKEQRNNIKASINIGCRYNTRIELELVYTFVIQFINFKLNYSYSEDYKALASQLDIIAKDVNAKIAAKNSREVEN